MKGGAGMGERMRGNEYRTTTVCVDSYKNGVPVGRFYNPACPKGIAFQSLSQLLVKLQNFLDGMQFPQAFTLTRAFSPREPEAGMDWVSPEARRTGALATFDVRILFRQNSSWQGSVLWQEGDREESFRSVLELVLLMDSAMDGQ